MKTIFIVLGVTGADEEQRSWLVKAFPSEREALAFIEKLESTYQSFEDEEETEDQLIDSMRVLDENFEFDPETGTEYSITECPFESSQRPIGRPEGDRRNFRGQEPSRNPKGSRRQSPKR